jgi:hypothetical protein
MNLKDIQMLKDCVMFTIDNDADLDEQDVKNLWAINMRLNQQLNEIVPTNVTITSQELEGDISTVKDSDYADKVDTLVGNMVANDDNVFTHDSEGC